MEIEIKMSYKKSTKGTHVYEAPDTAIPSVYIRREHLPTPAPSGLTLVIKDFKADDE
jgi:hypothetical protein